MSHSIFFRQYRHLHSHIWDMLFLGYFRSVKICFQALERRTYFKEKFFRVQIDWRITLSISRHLLLQLANIFPLSSWNNCKKRVSKLTLHHSTVILIKFIIFHTMWYKQKYIPRNFIIFITYDCASHQLYITMQFIYTNISKWELK